VIYFALARDFFHEGLLEDNPAQARKALHFYSAYHLCKEFGWTVDELLSQPADYVQEFIQIGNIIGEVRNQKAENSSRKYGKKS
jgi:hypothetical protein